MGCLPLATRPVRQAAAAVPIVLFRRGPQPNEGVVEWLLDCPEKGFFSPIESKSTDEL